MKAWAPENEYLKPLVMSAQLTGNPNHRTDRRAAVSILQMDTHEASRIETVTW